MQFRIRQSYFKKTSLKPEMNLNNSKSKQNVIPDPKNPLETNLKSLKLLPKPTQKSP